MGFVLVDENRGRIVQSALTFSSSSLSKNIGKYLHCISRQHLSQVQSSSLQRLEHYLQMGWAVYIEVIIGHAYQLHAVIQSVSGIHIGHRGPDMSLPTPRTLHAARIVLPGERGLPRALALKPQPSRSEVL